MKLSDEILALMRNQSTFTTWGFTIMGFREVALILKKKSVSVNNVMRALERKGILADSGVVGPRGVSTQWSDRGYKLVNENFKK